MSHDHAAAHGPSGLMKYLWSTDHKIIAFQYLFTGMAMAIIGGFTVYVFRMQLAFPGEVVPLFGRVSASSYNALVTSHGSIMIFWVAMPVLIAAFGNYLIPLMVGCDDMAFPKVNRLSYQIFLLSAVLMVASFFVPGGAFGGAWTAYPPLSTSGVFNQTPIGATMWLIAVALEFVAFLLGGINFITTTMNMRAPGMRMFDIPIVVWMIVIASVLFMASVGPLVAGAVMLLFDQLIGTGFYDPAHGGDPVLWQHLFWFFGHPEVYVVLFPAMGIVADVMAVHARKRLFAYRTIVYTAVATAIISFFVWAHHQFVAGIDPRMASLFSVTTLIISIPVAEMVFVYIATLYGGAISLTTPMLWALAFLVEFLWGGVTGIFLGAAGADLYLHDTYFVLAHFHYTFFPIAFIAGFAGITHWFPKMFGRMMDERLGKIHFWGTIISFNVIFMPLFITGAAGDHRRIFDYSGFPELNQPYLQNLRVVATYALLSMIAFQFVFFYNFVRSLRRGEVAGRNPWKATTLEWLADSPPPHGNFPVMPTVYRGPYEYGVPDRTDDYWPQNEPADGPGPDARGPAGYEPAPRPSGAMAAPER